MDKKFMIEEYNIDSLYGQVSEIVDSARLNTFKQVNLLQIITNLLIGKQIVEDEQQGNVRAKYGKAVLKTWTHYLILMRIENIEERH
ncbi:MAG: hypothetical protein Q4C60_08165 [Eubacteriales bacterium]|nr:hypothetical protein [Eubacteriales bacterium]